MRKFYMLATIAGGLGLIPQRAEAQSPASCCEHQQLAAYEATAPLNISLVDVNRTAVVYKKANASGVSINTGNVAGGIYVLAVTNGKKYYTRKIVIQ
ncbi:T9SS type A sorting domain-containing protein [Chitinophaga ginsengisoli]|uniref:Putative secreted protein (Por secretion system target) n=1 Tax=Chitinophaga ginsengisoli TaxID=363837 RepID=A0A2P8G366_9BACT|nr:T9SS type A sorting domain-containing protein [Chitinophaga ginsengisoli]PSL28325.1 putative secreted protein (Por secretion system target) [Chitinophaga ginsengisoli]